MKLTDIRLDGEPAVAIVLDAPVTIVVAEGAARQRVLEVLAAQLAAVAGHDGVPAAVLTVETSAAADPSPTLAGLHEAIARAESERDAHLAQVGVATEQSRRAADDLAQVGFGFAASDEPPATPAADDDDPAVQAALAEVARIDVRIAEAEGWLEEVVAARVALQGRAAEHGAAETAVTAVREDGEERLTAAHAELQAAEAEAREIDGLMAAVRARRAGAGAAEEAAREAYRNAADEVGELEERLAAVRPDEADDADTTGVAAALAALRAHDDAVASVVGGQASGAAGGDARGGDAVGGDQVHAGDAAGGGTGGDQVHGGDAGGDGERVRDARIAELTDFLEALRSRWRRRQAELDGARDDVARGRAAVAAAAAAARPLHLAADVVAELERLHEAVERAEAKAGGRLASPMAKRRLAHAVEAEREILDRVGLRSYADYLIRSSPMSIDADAQRRLIDASHRLATDERRLHDLETEAAPALADLAAEEERVLAELDALGASGAGEAPVQRVDREDVEVGGVDEVDRENVEAGVDVEVPRAGPEHDQEDEQDQGEGHARGRRAALVAALVHALRAAGADPGDDPVGAADAWLSACADMSAARRVALAAAEEAGALEDELEAARGRLAHAAVAIDELEVEAEPLEVIEAAERRAAVVAQVAAARARVAEIEASLTARGAEPAQEELTLDGLTRMLVDAQLTEDDARADLAALWATRADAEVALAAAREHAALRTASNPLTAALARLDVATAAEAAARTALDAASHQVESARHALAGAEAASHPGGAGRTGTHLVTQLEVHAQRLRTPNTPPLPIVLDVAGAALPRDPGDLLATVERLAADQQVVWVTDDDAVVAWASSLGDRRARVVRVPAT